MFVNESNLRRRYMDRSPLIIFIITTNIEMYSRLIFNSLVLFSKLFSAFEMFKMYNRKA